MCGGGSRVIFFDKESIICEGGVGSGWGIKGDSF